MPEDGGVRDAERLPWRPVDPNRAITPRHPEIWVRLAGKWRRGFVVALEPRAGGWDAWLQHDIPGDAAGWSEHEWIRWDPETMRPRAGNEPPG